MIEVRYIYSACVVIKTPDVKILCDPWFTDGIYDGSWFQFPKLDNPVDVIGDVDLIYISHIHPDHYDPKFLHKFMKKYGDKPLLIADIKANYLKIKSEVDGFKPEITTEKTVGATKINIVPHITGSISDIDSALIVKFENHCVVNTNDVIFDDEIGNKIKHIAGKIDILLCGYTGAGPYPQTYFDVSEYNLVKMAENKKQKFFDRYKKMVKFFQPKVTIPFAGKYILGGRLANLNNYRGVADAVEILAIDNKAVVLDDGGFASIDTVNLKPSKQRTELYSEKELASYIKKISSHLMDYEKLINTDQISQLPIKKLLKLAIKKAISKSEVNEDYFLAINVEGDQFAVFNTNKSSNPEIKIYQKSEIADIMPRSEIYIDSRYLFGLLTQVYHWNNAEVGSQFFVRRYPDVFNKDVQHFLNFLTL